VVVVEAVLKTEDGRHVEGEQVGVHMDIEAKDLKVMLAYMEVVVQPPLEQDLLIIQNIILEGESLEEEPHGQRPMEVVEVLVGLVGAGVVLTVQWPVEVGDQVLYTLV